MSDAKELGRLLGNISSQQSRIQENIYPDDPNAQLLVQKRDVIVMTMEGTVTANLLSPSSFYIDHPVYGDVDSAVLAIDGGYASSTTNQTFES